MKIPSYVKKAILRTSRANKIAHRNGEIVRHWLDRNNLTDDLLDMFIDYCEYSNDAGITFIQELEER